MEPSAYTSDVRNWAVYLLCDPSTDEARYVGQTRRRPVVRFRQHVKNADGSTSSHTAAWIRSLRPMQPKMVIVETLSSQALADEFESFLIAECRRKAARLTNAAPGGFSRSGWHHSEEYRARRSRDFSGPNHPRFGKPVSAEQIAKQKATVRLTGKRGGNPHGTRHSDETLAKIKEARKRWKMSAEGRESARQRSLARWANPEFRAHMIEIAIGRKHTPQSIQKMRQAQKNRSPKK